MGRKQLNFLLIGVLMVLTGLVYWSGDQQAEPDNPPLVSRAGEEIHSLVVENSDGVRLEFGKKSGRWWLQSPHETPVTDYQIDALLKIASTPSYWHAPYREESRQEYGLETRRGRVRVNDTWIAFGTTHPLDQKRYVRVGEKVHLVDDFFYHYTGMDWNEWVDKKLVPGGAELVSVTLFGHRLERDHDTWTLHPPVAELNVEELADAWQYATALSVDGAGETARVPADLEIRYRESEGGESTGPELRREFSVRRDGEEWLLIRHDLPLGYRLTAAQGDNLLLKIQPDADAKEAESGSATDSRENAGTSGG